MLRLLQTAVVISTIVFSTTIKAQSPEPAFPSTVRLPSTKIELVKIGEHRYFHNMFFKVYDIALYSAKSAKIEEILNAKTNYQLVFRFLRKIDKSMILKSADKILAKNLDAKEYYKIKTRLNRLNTNYQNIEKGDHSSLTYQPGIGTSLIINDSPIVTIEGEDFAKLYFTIWLGELPISKSLRRDLIGNSSKILK